MIIDLSKKSPRGARTYRHLDLANYKRGNEGTLLAALHSPYIWLGMGAIGAMAGLFKLAAYVTAVPTPDIDVIANMIGSAISIAWPLGLHLNLHRIPERIDTSGHGSLHDYKTEKYATLFKEYGQTSLIFSFITTAATAVGAYLEWHFNNNAMTEKTDMKYMHQAVSTIGEILMHAASFPMATTLSASAALLITSQQLTKRRWNIASRGLNSAPVKTPEVPEGLGVRRELAPDVV